MSLTWVKASEHLLMAYTTAGGYVGYVHHYPDDRVEFEYQAMAVRNSRHARVRTLSTAKRAIERQWKRFLRTYGLQEIPS